MSGRRKFLNPDPLGFGGGLNFYAYANGNPVSYLDPFGLSAVGDYFSGVGQVFAGYGLAGRDTAVGLWNVAAHPVNTVEGLYNVGTHPVQAYNAISQSVANTWNSGLTGQGEIVGNVLIAAASFGATKATSIAGQAGEAGDLVTVSRWGRAGLETGDWVMNGPATDANYALSGKWDPFPWNQSAPLSSGAEFTVPASDVYWPTGLGLDGRIKGVLGQRIYDPNGMGWLGSDEAAAISGAGLSGFYNNNSSSGSSTGK